MKLFYFVEAGRDEARRIAVNIAKHPARRAVNKRLTREEARRMALNFAKLPDLLAVRKEVAHEGGSDGQRG